MPINYKDYPSNWMTEIRPSVLLRANNCCEFCGVPNHAMIFRPFKGKSDWRLYPDGTEGDTMAIDGIASTKIVLTVAHLDHDKLNHDINIDRLRALCQRCHLGYDMKRHVYNRKYGRRAIENNLKLEL